MSILKNTLLLVLLLALFIGVNTEVPISDDNISYAKISLTGPDCDKKGDGSGHGVPEPSLIMIVVLGAGGAIVWRIFRNKKK